MPHEFRPPRTTLETILVVDDLATNIEVIGGLLQDQGYRVLAAADGESALRYAARSPAPDLVLLDVVMPGIDGYEVLRRLREAPASAQIPVVFLTALGEAADEERGLALGAADYVTKPIRPAILLARVRTQLDAAYSRRVLRDQNAMLEAEVRRRMAENELIQTVAVRALAHLAETRDPETGNPLLRTPAYVQTLAIDLQGHPVHRTLLTDRYIELLARSAPLHDIGKVGIPDHILLKPGKLDGDEWKIMQTHAALGARAIEQAEADAAQPIDFLATAKEIAHWHHERWDGSGYPDRLRGEAIPLSARLMALADVFDALISPRVYKAPMSCEAAREIIREGRGSHFDPAVHDAFERQFDAFRGIAARYADAGMAEAA
ncbi:MAG: response regulator [Burkholderiales bacterium]|nr:response regulator [Burkholderiales bacterium]